MAKEIATGIDQIIQRMTEREIEGSQAQWRAIRNRMDSILSNNNIYKIDESRKLCGMLDNMNNVERTEFIKKHWGENYFNRVMPVLQQLAVIESVIESESSKS
jgi:hypothetical protein